MYTVTVIDRHGHAVAETAVRRREAPAAAKLALAQCRGNGKCVLITLTRGK